MNWMPTSNQVAQLCHFSMAWACVMTAAVFGGTWWLGFVITLCWATPKEFAWDIVMEPDSWSDSAEDWTWYMIGAVVSTGLIWFR